MTRENPGSLSLVERARVMQRRYEKTERRLVGLLFEELADRIEELEKNTERLWCTACGTVTRSNICDCNNWPEGHEMRREPNFVNYADQNLKSAKQLADRIDELEALIEWMENMDPVLVEDAKRALAAKEGK
jgi:hypothetical protein